MNRNEVLDRVGGLLLLPNTELATTKQVAEFYGVETKFISCVQRDDKSEVESNGMEKGLYAELKESLLAIAGTPKKWLELSRFYGIATGNTKLYSRKAVLNIGFLLDESVVAEEVRRLVMTTNVAVATPIKAELIQKQHNDMVVPFELEINAVTRAEYAHRTDVLDMVGKLEFLPNSQVTTTKKIAKFYGVNEGSIHSILTRKREGFLSDNVKKIDYHKVKLDSLRVVGKNQDWRDFCWDYGISPNTNVYSKRAVLIIGCLLNEYTSPVARKVRELALTTEQVSESTFVATPVTVIEGASMGAIVVPNNTMPTVAIEPTIEAPQKKHNNMRGEPLVLDGRDVAEMMGKKHAHLMRDIKGYVEILNESNFGLSDFFVQNTYQDTTGRTLPCYLLTKKGCDMVANKMTGAKGVLFTATYVTRFEEMENQLKSQVVTVASYMINDPIKRAEQWIAEQKEVALLAEKVREQVEVIEHNKRTCIYENLS